MNLTIRKANLDHVENCKDALCQSKLGEEYFASEEKAINTLTGGINKGEVYVALDETGHCLGFIWFILEGIFHSFPFLHIIAVKKEYRGQGIGRKLLAFFEETVFPDKEKVFLVVADFNPEAQRLYERLGYKQVGVIPGLYKEGVTEYLMMKERLFTEIKKLTS
ncbi:MAG TPA: N-acetyltransferase [Longilinea sp.]|nr:N-acetyltransferase [Longilinea sp.]